MLNTYQKIEKFINLSIYYRNYGNSKMRKQKRQNKSGSGKVSSLTNTLFEEWTKTESQLPFINDISIHLTRCIHGNNYFLCQQCEIRIRNQDIMDRIDYTTNKYGFDEPITVKQEETSKHFIVSSDMLASVILKDALIEFSCFYYSKVLDGFNTGEGY